MRLTKIFVGTVLVVGVVAVGTPAMADPPGPGDTQCVPGLNPQHQPGKKTGTCPGHLGARDEITPRLPGVSLGSGSSV